MVKRPLVWILGAYLLGIGLAWQHLSMVIIAIITIICYSILYFNLRYHKEKGIHKKQVLFWLLPLFMILGYIVMEDQSRLPKLYYDFEQEIPCELKGRIRMVVKKQQGQALYIENNQIFLSNGTIYPCENVLVFTSDNLLYRIGNQITVQGTLQKFKRATNPGQFNEENYYKALNIDFKLISKRIIITDKDHSVYASFLEDLKRRLINVYEDILEEREAGTLTAMLLGEKYLLEDEVKQLYQENGISHVLAISGLHVSLIGMSIFWLLRKCKRSIITATSITILFVYSYGIMTNFSVSTNRAVVMMIVLLLATPFGKTYDMLSATALSAFLILLQNPFQLMNAGFLLSFLAVIGIAVLFPSLKRLFPGDNKLKAAVLLSSSAMIATTPAVLVYFYQFPIYGILTNLIILPFVTVLTLTSLAAGFLGILSADIGVFVIGGANYILKLYDLVCEKVRLLPYHLTNVGKPSPLLIALSFLLIVLFIWLSNKYHKKYLIVILLLSQLIFFRPIRQDNLRITLLDVGQGDAIYMESRMGTSFLVDGGSTNVSKVGTYRIVPFLKVLGKDKLDYIILTHTDQDHINGVVELLRQNLFPVGCLILPVIMDKDEAYLTLEALAQEKGIGLQYMKAGDFIKEGLLQITCLHPSFEDAGLTSNAGSMVLSVTYGEFDMLLTGDLEKEGEKRLLTRLLNKEYFKELGISPVIDIDVLKVAHHGSKYSTTEDFLKLVRPEYALISCSKTNRYGHPHQELLNRLELVDSQVEITYETGAITIWTDGERMRVERYIN